MNVKKYIRFIQAQGIMTFAAYAVRALFFVVYGFSFRRCGRIFIVGSFRFTGKRYIQIGSLSLGRRVRIDAVSRSNDQRFHPSIEIGHNVSFGDDIHIGCTNRIQIGNNILGGSHIYITDHDHGIYGGEPTHSDPSVTPVARRVTENGQVIIGDNVLIGEFVTITKNVTVGSGAVIGAMSVVTRDIPPNTVAAGNPARVVKRYDADTRRWIAAR